MVEAQQEAAVEAMAEVMAHPTMESLTVVNRMAVVGEARECAVAVAVAVVANALLAARSETALRCNRR